MSPLGQIAVLIIIIYNNNNHYYYHYYYYYNSDKDNVKYNDNGINNPLRPGQLFNLLATS